MFQTPPEFPFNKIAVTISGGGFRAAAYGLGCLSYLDSVKIGEENLLSRVHFVASASGGTMPAMLLATYQAKGKSFNDCYHHLRNQVLKGTDLLKKVNTVLNDDKVWKEKYPLKTRNLINAFAIVYDQLLFEGETFGVYWNKAHNPTIQEVCFNSAEMVNGRTFRFETNGLSPTKLFVGNRYLKVHDNSKDCVKEMRLGDIMAASSCFPGGFEPIIFPNDFAINQNHNNELLGNLVEAIDYDYTNYTPSPHSFSLMDGGITDNQAMESLKLADLRRREDKEGDEVFDLMLVFDVANYFMDDMKATDSEKKWWSVNSIQRLVNLHKYAAVILSITAVFLLVFYKYLQQDGVRTIPHYILFLWGLLAISGVMTTLYTVGYFRFQNTLQKLKMYIGKSGWVDGAKGIINFFLQLPLYKSIAMMQERITTVMRILMDVQLLQIRRLNYDFAFNKPEWFMRFKAVNVYELSSSNHAVRNRYFDNMSRGNQANQANLNHSQVDFLRPNTNMQQIAEYARSMGTTLWFTPKDESENVRDKLIATGQFTTCFNLLNHAYQLINIDHTYTRTIEFQSLLNRLEDDWKKFQENPMWKVQ